MAENITTSELTNVTDEQLKTVTGGAATSTPNTCTGYVSSCRVCTGSCSLRTARLQSTSAQTGLGLNITH